MASTTFIDQQTIIYADWLNDTNNAVYNGVFPNGSITLTTLAVSGSVSGAGFTNLVNNTLSAPGAIGSATPNTGAFTTLSATTFSASSISTLSTPLSRANGGTGLSAAGTSGFVLTSNGTNWTSALNPTIGVGQTWQDVTSSRAINTDYTNSTGKPIMVAINFNTGTSGAITVDGVFAGIGATTVSEATGGLNTIVPNGSVYRYTGGASIIAWSELR
jgi:hypothetical protein